MMAAPPIPLLITSHINPIKCLVNLYSPELRLSHTIESLEYWTKNYPDLKIVICDGSNFDFSNIIKEKFSGHLIEFLYFQNSTDKVLISGKGYGEGEIIKYALSNSKILQNSSAFMKCTGKLWVSNLQPCLNEWNGVFNINAHFLNVFNFKPIFIDYLDTRFFITDKNFYIKYLKNAYLETNYGYRKSIEHIFLEKILGVKIKNFIFFTNPIINGFGGGLGAYYKNNIRRKSKNFLKKWIISKNYRFKDLLSAACK